MAIPGNSAADTLTVFLWRGSLVLLVLCLQGIQCDLVLETVTLAPSGGDFTLAPSGGDLDTCSTRLENGIVNLWPIGNSSDPPRWRNMSANNPKLDPGFYYFDPCYPFTVDVDNCTDSLVCRNSSKGMESIGLAGQSKFGYNQYNQLTIEYAAGETTGEQKITQVTLICNEFLIEDTLEILGNSTPNVFKMTLTSRCCCPGVCDDSKSGLSFGSVLCILFVCAVFIYLLFGMLYMKFVRGASGIELIPNHEFWSDLPKLISEGVNFVFTCGQGTESISEAPGTGPKSNYESI
ncbi:cation-dependent mannose-6-phosphate receptor-like [Apostichopus japonicus]|uniref:cation-dependent mannose-6-phosphate receptor-like n=1 Tax=Stichopus japonicus TaxID=307972 RepID=UPI003AB805FB